MDKQIDKHKKRKKQSLREMDRERYRQRIVKKKKNNKGKDSCRERNGRMDEDKKKPQLESSQ